MRSLWCCAALALGLSVTGEVRAQSAGKGTHGIVGVDVGPTLSSTPRAVGTLQVGAGGKLRGTPLRSYVIGELGYGRSRREETGAFAHERRDDLSLGAGLRLYLAVPDPWRVHFDLLAGASRVVTELLRHAQASPLQHEGWVAQLTLGAGLQYRLLQELSLGVRVRVLFAKHALEAVREQLDAKGHRPVMLLAGVTWHF